MAYDPHTFKRNAGHLHKLAPDASGAFAELHTQAFAAGELDTATKELMALAISIVDGCEDCCGYHLERAQAAGVSEAAIGETLAVTTAMGGGPAYTYAAKVAAMVAGDGGT